MNPAAEPNLTELDQRYYARMVEIIRRQPGMLRGARWFRTSWSNYDGTGIFHSTYDCPAIRDIVDQEARGNPDLFELDLSTGAAWKWTASNRWTFPGLPPLPAGWHRPADEPWYSPGTDPEELAERLDMGWDPIEPAWGGEADRVAHLELEGWRSCKRCGAAPQPQPVVCPRCWLTPCDCG